MRVKIKQNILSKTYKDTFFNDTLRLKIIISPAFKKYSKNKKTQNIDFTYFLCYNQYLYHKYRWAKKTKVNVKMAENT